MKTQKLLILFSLILISTANTYAVNTNVNQTYCGSHQFCGGGKDNSKFCCPGACADAWNKPTTSGCFPAENLPVTGGGGKPKCNKGQDPGKGSKNCQCPAGYNYRCGGYLTSKKCCTKSGEYLVGCGECW